MIDNSIHESPAMRSRRLRRAICATLLVALLATVQTPTEAANVASITSWTTGTAGPSRSTSGTDRLLVFMAGAEAGSDVTIDSVTYGGRAMTQVVTVVAGTSSFERCYIFYLNDSGISAASSNTFSVSWSSGTSDVYYAARMYQNVNQSAPIRDFDLTSTESSTPNPIETPNLTVRDDDLVVAAAVCGQSQSYSWNNGLSEGTDQAGSSSQMSTADTSISSDGAFVASATNGNPNQQVIIAAVLQSTTASTFTTYYVRPAGSDSNSGTGPSGGEAWQTIREATRYNGLNPGDVIYVKSGTYTERIQPDEDGALGLPIRVVADREGTVAGWSAGDVIIKHDSEKVIDLDKDDYWSFEGFKIEGDSSKEAIKIKDSKGIVLKSLEIYDAKKGIKTDETDIIIANCIVRDSDEKGLEISDSKDDVIIYHSVFAHNGKHGIEHKKGSLSLYNSIMAYNGDDGYEYKDGSVSHGYNLSYGNAGQNFAGVSANSTELQLDPQFVSVAGRDYQLQGTSPAINSGTDASTITLEDLLGAARPLGSGWDMGAYEYALLGVWHMDDGSGTTVADSSGNGQDGSLEGSAVWETARCGFAVKLDGTADWIDLGQIDIGTKTFTVAAWFNTSSNTRQTIFAATAPGTSDHAALVEMNSDGQIQFVHRSTPASSGGTTLSSSDSYRDGTWHQVVAIKSNSELQLYVDGELVDSVSDATSVHSSVDVALGRFGTNSGQHYLQGSIDEVHLYGTALSKQEIADLSGMVARWRLDETTGTTAFDTFPLEKHGDYKNGVTLGGSGPASGRLAATFDGIDDHVELPSDNTDYSGGFTISLWARPTATKDGAKFIDIGGGQAIDNIYLGRNGTGSNIVLNIRDGSLGSNRSIYASDAITNNAWHHYAATVDATGTGTIYVDGVEVASGNIGIPPVATRSSNFIGRSNWSTNEYYEGQMHDVRLYDRELCADEIADLYGGGKPSKGLRITKWIEIE